MRFRLEAALTTRSLRILYFTAVTIRALVRGLHAFPSDVPSPLAFHASMSCAGVVVPSGGDTAPGVTLAFKRFFLCFLVAGTFAACSNSLAPTTASSTGAGAAACTGTCTLTGQVVQQGTSNGVASAALTLANGSGVVTTSTADATGAFSFPNLPAGVYALQTAAPGYVVAVANLTMPTTNFTVQLTPINAPATPKRSGHHRLRQRRPEGRADQPADRHRVVYERHITRRDQRGDVDVERANGGHGLIHRPGDCGTQPAARI